MVKVYGPTPPAAGVTRAAGQGALQVAAAGSNASCKQHEAGRLQLQLPHCQLVAGTCPPSAVHFIWKVTMS